MPFSRRPSVSASVCQGLGARASRAHTSPDAFSQTDLAFTVMCLPSFVVVVVVVFVNAHRNGDARSLHVFAKARQARCGRDSVACCCSFVCTGCVVVIHHVLGCPCASSLC